jgi:hypothetical protein
LRPKLALIERREVEVEGIDEGLLALHRSWPSGERMRSASSSKISAVAGKLELTVAANQATAYGVLLDPSVDTAAKFSDNSVTGSVARAGSFRGPALIVGVGVDPVALVGVLRDRGIFTEGPITVPTALAAEPEAA